MQFCPSRKTPESPPSSMYEKPMQSHKSLRKRCQRNSTAIPPVHFRLGGSILIGTTTSYVLPSTCPQQQPTTFPRMPTETHSFVAVSSTSSTVKPQISTTARSPYRLTLTTKHHCCKSLLKTTNHLHLSSLHHPECRAPSHQSVSPPAQNPASACPTSGQVLRPYSSS